MKKLLFILPGLCFLASWAAAETIESVSFNPARLGRYESLKVSDTLTTPGGIEANAMTVQSGGTVNFSNNQHYQADAVSVKGKVDMPNTFFRVPTLNSKGTASFDSKDSTAESSISTLNNSLSRIKANILDLGSVTVTGASTLSYSGTSVSGLTLGNNTIPVPATACKNLQWITRKTDNGYTYQVLGFSSCATTNDPDDEEKDDCQGECGAHMYKDCMFPEGNGNAWCFLYTYDQASCSYKKDASNPSWGIRCPALDNMTMASSTCSCEAEEEESEWVWAKQGSAFTVFNTYNSWPVMSKNGTGSCSVDMNGCYGGVNTSLARLALGADIWNDQSVPRCSSSQTEGSSCSESEAASACFNFGTAENLYLGTSYTSQQYYDLFINQFGGAYNYMLSVFGSATGVQNAVLRLKSAPAYTRSAQLMMCKHKDSL